MAKSDIVEKPCSFHQLLVRRARSRKIEPFLHLLHRDLLHRPGRAIAFVDYVGRFAVDFVDQTGALPVPETGLRPPEQLPVLQIELIELTSQSIDTISVLRCTGADAQSPWRTHAVNRFPKLK